MTTQTCLSPLNNFKDQQWSANLLKARIYMDKIIQGLWIGNSLSKLEQLSIRSFLSHGHEYHLYVYDDVAGVPHGTILKDGNDILPSSMIFQYSKHKSYSGFSNFFRYKLLLEKGGWWVDADVVCLKPFIFNSEYVLATERDSQGREFVTSCVIKAPPGAEIMNQGWAICQAKNPQELEWGETGPNLTHRLAIRLLLCKYIYSADVFCPIDPYRWMEALIPGRHLSFTNDTFAVHLWNELWRRTDLNKDEIYAPNCLYEHLKRRYLPNTAE
jgi:hypothetical protein